MPIDLTHKFISLSGLESQFFTEVTTLRGFVIFKISAVISSYCHDALVQDLENSLLPSRGEGFRERKHFGFTQQLNLPIKLLVLNDLQFMTILL
jgi:hypothetical protein